MVSNAQPHGGSHSLRADQARALERLKEALELLDKSSAPADIRARLHESIEALYVALAKPD